ncbi:hypothetical protein P0W64_09535 [Tsukamurella sp. 8F]|uniref:DUF6928 family protein n=1 Tax=unclassified Tsukamurella TaxID=2633480 RepID=UPI0023B97778|nr:MULTISPECIES: hypothetical protein [unclassified Tsukamurella]MDF0529820.1 hypothetical protein [Tsukamurella sp. 8J]MDF0587012.1 hypothetical protein [Tsukamurella sp. 8F]
MGARAATIWFSDVADPKGRLAIAHASDELPARSIAERILGAEATSRTVSLAEAADPAPGRVYVGAYGGLTVVSHADLSTAKPSELDGSWRELVHAKHVFLLSTQPDRSVGAFAHWVGDDLKRSFSAHPVDIIEDIGLPEVFERPFWAGEHPLAYAPGVEPDPRALPFHPMEFAEQANRQWLGFRYTYPLDITDLDPARIPVLEFRLPGDEDAVGDEHRWGGTPGYSGGYDDGSGRAPGSYEGGAGYEGAGYDGPGYAGAGYERQGHHGPGHVHSDAGYEGVWGPGPDEAAQGLDDEGADGAHGKGRVRRWFGF